MSKERMRIKKNHLRNKRIGTKIERGGKKMNRKKRMRRKRRKGEQGGIRILKRNMIT